ncbi:FHA domain-containing protein [Kribbella sp. NPDC059898]|uniref:FHA domain-containing protein n=1 Tax=Kribbella sp. NPDC059898 TaxID=3346995 RepID=UPI0036541FEA
METEFVLSLDDQRWPLPSGATTITIGRASNADIRLQADDQISRIHARLTREATTWTLHDESRNGTGLNGHRLTAPTPLTNGDRIHIGRSILTFQTPTTNPHTEEPPAGTPPHTAPPPASGLPSPDPTGTPPYAEPADAPEYAESADAPAYPEPANPSYADPSAAYDEPGSAPSYAEPTDPPANPFENDAYAATPDVHSSPEAPPAAPSTGSHRAPAPADYPPGPPPTQQQHPTPFPASPTATPPSDYPAEEAGRNPFAPEEDAGSSPFAPEGAPAGPGSDAAPAGYPAGSAGPFAPEDAAGSRAIQASGYPADGAGGYAAGGPGVFAADGGAADGQAAQTRGYPADGPGGYPAGGAGVSAADGGVAGGQVAQAGGYPADGAGSYPAGGAGAFAADGGAGDGRAAQVGGLPADGAGGYSDGGAGVFAADGGVADGRAAQASGYPAAVGVDGRAFGVEVGDESGGREDGPVGLVPGFEGRDGGTWAAYPSADNPEPVRSPWEVSGQIDQSQPNWNESDSWPTDRRSPDGDGRADQQPESRGPEQQPTNRLPDQQRAGQTSDGDPDAVGTVRLLRVLIVSGGIVVLGLLVNLIASFFAAGPGGMLRWLIAPSIALVAGMVLALIDAAAPKPHRPGKFDVSVLIAIAIVLVGIGVGGFALTAGTEYVAGYLTGNESGADRLVKPVAKAGSGITVTVENVTYTSHFTRIEVQVANSGKQAFTIPIDGTTFTAADGTALHADPGKSSWPSRIDAGGAEHGTITFKGHLPDSATQAVLTFKSGSTTFAVPKVILSK